jgi:hypothetical protein
VGIGYSAFFAYSYFTDATSRDDFGKKLDEIEDSTGLNLKQVNGHPEPLNPKP